MRLYLQVKDVNPPDGFQPKTAITVTDKTGGEVELFFESSDALAAAASTLANVAMEADWKFRDLMREHFAQARDIQFADEDKVYDAMVDDARYFAGINDEVA